MRYIIIPAADLDMYKEKRITPWWEINPIKLKDGNYVLPIKALDDMAQFTSKQLKFKRKDGVISNYDIELKKYNTTDKPIFPDPIPLHEIIDDKINT